MKIAVGGMIASGKSKLSEALSKELQIPIVPEFEDNDIVFNTMLDWLYTKVDNTEMLLQIYFIHNQLIQDRKIKKPFIVDRDLFERKIFADINLDYDLETKEIYNHIFNLYVNKIQKPDLYIILDVDWNNFYKRLLKRGRNQEIDNFDINKDYFKTLHKEYTNKLKELCIKYNVDYLIIDTNDKTEEEIKLIAIDNISQRLKKK